MNDYGIEIQNKDNGLWHRETIVKPERREIQRKFLGLIPYTDIETVDTVSTLRTRACNCAKTIYHNKHHSVRIVELYYNLEDHDYVGVRVIWQNGAWL